MGHNKRILVVGGVAGGASAAARLRRLSETVEIVMFERGEHISFANCGLPYHIGGVIPDRSRLLVQTPAAMAKRYRIDVRTRTEVVRIDRQKREVIARNLATGQETAERYDALILSPGAEPVKPPIPGSDSKLVFTLRNLTDMDAIKRVVDENRPHRAVVVGGGYIGLEMAEALRHRRVEVTLVELADQVFVAADPEMVAPLHDELRRNGVDRRLGTSVTAIDERDGQLAVTLCDGQVVSAGLAILAIGVRPEVKLAREAGLELGQTGAIAVDAHMRTSDPDIYAVGDAVEVTHLVNGAKVVIPLAGPANRQGRIAADNILGRKSVYRASQGTAICKVFDVAIGMTGLSENLLKKSGMRYEKVYVHPASHAGYYPGARQMSLKLLFDPETGKVLGGQAVGADGIDKRIDVLAVAIRAGLTVEDLAEQELAYAPPYGSAKDPINYAGFVAANVRSGDVKICHVSDILNRRADQVVLDVRVPDEVAAGSIPGAINIPLDDLRDRLGELSKDKEYLVVCQVGLRGYLACRILSQHGFACRNLSGGYKTYAAVTGVSGWQPQTKQPGSDTGEKGPVATGQTAACCGGVDTSKADVPVVKRIDATALACPGPIMRLKAEMESLDTGQAIEITAGEPGFARDVTAWCHSTGNRLVEIVPAAGGFRATIQKDGVHHAPAVAAAPAPKGAVDPKAKTMVVFSGDLDKALAAFIIANGAAAMGSRVTMFFTFWGVNILRKPEKVAVRKNLLERMFGWMMPRGAGRLALSKMHMAGMGAAMIKRIMRKKNVPSLAEMIEQAQKAGVKMVVCTMSMDLMGIRREELIDGVEEGGVATYLNTAEAGNVNLFI